MKLKDIFSDHKTKVFVVTDQDDENQLNWILEPTAFALIPDDEGFYFVAAKEVSATEMVDCFIGISTPERFVDYVVKQSRNGVVRIEGDYDQIHLAIPSIAAECYGDYELFYAKENPQVGIDILKEGLLLAVNKSTVASDLGYILRDEGRFAEAIEAFLIAEEAEPSSFYTFWELSELYGAIGQPDKQHAYKEKFLAAGGNEW